MDMAVSIRNYSNMVCLLHAKAHHIQEEMDAAFG